MALWQSDKARYGVNLAASAGKKLAFDWPLAFALGIPKKANPFGPYGKGDPENLYGLGSWLQAWDPEILRGPGFIEQWFHPAAKWATQKLPEKWREGFSDWKGEGAVTDKLIDEYFEFLNETGQKIEDTEYPMDRWFMEKMGYTNDEIANMKAAIVDKFKGADPNITFNEATGLPNRTDIISKFGEGAWAATPEVKTLYSTLEENAMNGEFQTDNYQTVFNNPFYKGIQQNPQLLELFNQVDPSTLEDIQNKAFLKGDEAINVFQVLRNNLAENQIPYMDVFFVDNNMANADGLNAVINHNLDKGGDYAKGVNNILSGQGPTIAHFLRQTIYGSNRTADLTDEGFESLLNDSKMSFLHSTDSGMNLRGAFESMSYIPGLQEEYLQLSPSYKATSGFFDVRELPFIDESKVPRGVQNLQDVVAHGIETPWITPPTDELKDAHAYFNPEQVGFDWEEGLHMKPTSTEEYMKAKDMWTNLDEDKQESLLSEMQLPVDAAVLTMLPGVRSGARKLGKKVADPAGITTLLDTALPEAMRDVARGMQ